MYRRRIESATVSRALKILKDGRTAVVLAMSAIEIFCQSRFGWLLADSEPDLSAVGNVGNLPMQIPEE